MSDLTTTRLYIMCVFVKYIYGYYYNNLDDWTNSPIDYRTLECPGYFPVMGKVKNFKLVVNFY